MVSHWSCLQRKDQADKQEIWQNHKRNICDLRCPQWLWKSRTHSWGPRCSSSRIGVCGAYAGKDGEGPTARCWRPFRFWAMGERRLRHSDKQLVFWSCILTPYLRRVLSKGWDSSRFNAFKGILAQSLADLSLDFGATQQRIQTLQS